MGEILSKVKTIHLVGIGGIGMSGLALLLKDKGFLVSGSDSQEGYQIKKLKDEGIPVFIGHHKDQVPDGVHMLGYSSAVPEDNPEIEEAKRRGIQIIKRGRLLAELCRDNKTIAVAGSHGKTTTTALIGYLLTSLEFKPTVFLGGSPLNYSRDAWWGSQYCVIETDESDGSFLCYDPWVSVITNIDCEHLDYYRTIDEINSSFLTFARKTKSKVFGWGDQSSVAEIIDKVEGIKFGWGDSNQVQGRNFKFQQQFSCFDLLVKGDFITSVKVPLVGEHNCRNSLAALAVCWYLGEDLKRVAKIIEGFRGTKRRFQVKEVVAGVTFVDDYAHHPTEIKAVIQAARLLGPKRIFVILQPHRYSRVNLLFSQFFTCFSEADKVIVTDIYSAQEPRIEGISAESLSLAIKQHSSVDVEHVGVEKLSELIPGKLKPGDLVLALGAGDINSRIDKVIYEFKKNRAGN
ncbi:MAG: UDP-N-acetylmuramate--L-alanine ligase [Candidatus Omnitrophica bacterium]|nr:UDP-N-acetylmuramate--L-alanine ligase [Candidatus Omnitrophota bacterium]MBU2044841.1 UDP-N-acetylmuramate--L-alanine ligase [Candidatus Omnitrophota bacterium]MBU2251158.1 UDP-N-acetylmuramate--L-alanine ligase [Candidatus Omnitrophota bacterium]MBU2473644.1 UDP-N-acetylmuramate--L-alanine ligase [Candidatus Omnitrophota bacterium]